MFKGIQCLYAASYLHLPTVFFLKVELPAEAAEQNSGCHGKREGYITA